MSKFTTGEIAKLSGVSVRTVQYYDERGILVPSELSEGGRRLYTEDDLKRMHVICFLREVGIPISGISALFAEDNPQNVISILLDEQAENLKAELSERQSKLDTVNSIKRELKEIEDFSVESIIDIAQVMNHKKQLTKMRLTMVLTAIPLAALQVGSIALWITTGIWWLFVIWAAIAIPFGIGISAYYFKHIAYICPECHRTFRPEIKEAFFAYHTPRMRRLTCKNCGKKRLCVEVYREEKKENKV